MKATTPQINTEKPAEKETTPNGAKIELLITINPDNWDELVEQGYTEKQLEAEILKEINLPKSHLIFDTIGKVLIKFY